MKSSFSSKLFLLLILFSGTFSSIVLITSCTKQEEPMTIYGPAPAPRLSTARYHYDRGNDSLAALGRILFYDKNLSLNNAISCGSCHKQEKAFADNHQFSIGLYNKYSTRNTSAIFSSFNHNKFWDGRAASFDTAVFMPVMNHAEMDIFDLNILAGKLSTTSYYPDLFKATFGTSEINIARIRSALATFVENLYSANSKYDRAYPGFPVSFFPEIATAKSSDIISPVTTLDEFEEQGKKLFFGKAACYQCHSGSDFNGYSTSYENIGLEVNYNDKGRADITKQTSDDGKFIVPTLRNIALTAPYMHDGRFKTLSEVIDHYNDGIQNSSNLSFHFRDLPDMSTFIDTFTTQTSAFRFLNTLPVKKLNLTLQEKKALETFLNTLTDVTFITDPKFSNPF